MSGILIQTSFDGTKITQECLRQMEKFGGEPLEAVLWKRCIDTGEEQIRDALIAMGWKPPERSDG